MGIRINSDDGDIENGLRNAQWVEIAAELARWGQFDYISCSHGTYADRMLIYGTSVAKRAGYEVEATSRIKEVVGDTPVVVTGRISTPEMAEEILASGKADFVGMARQLIADPMWPTKAAAGQADDIRPCIGANYCLQGLFRGPLSCIHNPAVGREREYRAQDERPRPSSRKVAVVGGGPAGLRTALTAAERGHRVTLFERGERLGGQVNLMAEVDAYREWSGVTDWLQSQLAKNSAEIVLKHDATVGDLASGFDAVVLATGSRPLRHGWTSAHPARWAPTAQPLPGSDQWNVYTPADVLGGRAELLKSILIVDDLGDRQALVTAEFLATRRHAVRILSRFPSVGHVLSDSHDLGMTFGRLRKMGVTVIPNSEVTRIDGDRIEIADVYTGDPSSIDDVDGVVLTLGGQANDELARELRATHPPQEIHLVGDCLAPRRIFNAIYDGDRIGRAL